MKLAARMARLKRWWLPAGLLVLAAQLLVTLTYWSVWHDESFTAVMIKYPWRSIIERTAMDVHPPLYYLALKTWAHFLGDSAMALRSLSAVTAVAGVWTAYQLVRRLFTITAARWALLPMVLAPFIVRFGQEARMYTLAALLLLLATHCLVSIAGRGAGRTVWRVGYVVLMTAALYTHYFTILVLPGHLLYLWHAQLKRKPLTSQASLPTKLRQIVQSLHKSIYAMLILPVLFFVPWMPKLFNQTTAIQDRFWIPKTGWDSLPGLISDQLLFRDTFSGLNGIWLIAALSWMVLALWWAIRLWRDHPTWRSGLVLVAGYAVLPPIWLFILSQPPLQPVFYDRYLTLFAPVWYGAVGLLMMAAWQGRARYHILSWLMIGGTLGMLGVGLVRVQIRGNYNTVAYEQYTMKDLMRTVNQEYRAGDIIVAKGLAVYFDARFYDKTPTPVLVYTAQHWEGIGNTSVIYDQPQFIARNLETVAASGNRVWLVSKNNDPNTDLPRTWRPAEPHVSRGYAQVRLYHVGE